MTKAQSAERDEAIRHLREWMPIGSKVYTIVRHVSRTGNASVSAIIIGQWETPDSVDDVSLSVARALGFKMDPDHGGVKVGYMGERRDAALIHDLARVLHGSSTALNQVEL